MPLFGRRKKDDKKKEEEETHEAKVKRELKAMLPEVDDVFQGTSSVMLMTNLGDVVALHTRKELEEMSDDDEMDPELWAFLSSAEINISRRFFIFGLGLCRRSPSWDHSKARQKVC